MNLQISFTINGVGFRGVFRLNKVEIFLSVEVSR